MLYSELEQILKDNDKESINKIFKDYFSFNNDIIVDQIDNYDQCDLDDLYEDIRRFGCIVKNNNVIVPTGLQFRLTKSNYKEDPILFYIERNGVIFSITYMDYNEDINVTLTQFGQNLFSFSKTLYTTIPNAYDIIKQVEKNFKISIIS